MKILYLCPGNYSKSDGIYQKVTKKILYWEVLGVEPTLVTYDSFQHSSFQKWLLNKLRGPFRTLFYFILFSINTNRQIKKVNPDFIYTRHFLFPFLLPKKYVLVLEVNGDILKENIHAGRFAKLLIKMSIKYYNKHAAALVLAGDMLGQSFQEIPNKLVLPNSILSTSKEVLENFNYRVKHLDRIKREKAICFMASKNRPFYAVDRIIELVNSLSEKYKLWLVGNFTEKDFPHRDLQHVVFCGPKSGNELSQLLYQATLAIGSVNLKTVMDGKASPLKVRTYLEHGLPVFTYDNDCDFSSITPYYHGTPFSIHSNFSDLKIELETFLNRKEIENPDLINKLPSEIKQSCLDFREKNLIQFLETLNEK